MLAKRIIPCLDVNEGRVVKGINFINLVDAGDPVENAVQYDREHADELVFLDITASSSSRNTIIDVVERVAESVYIPFTVGGGIRSVQNMRSMLLAGADKTAMNTAAVLNPSLISEGARMFGSQCVVVAVDAKAKSDGTGWEVYTHGGRTPTGIDVLEWVQRAESLGAGEILLTSMDRDGTQSGYDISLTRSVADAVRIPVIASGGAGKLEHFSEGILEGHADAVLAASLFHFKQLTIESLKEHFAQCGIPVRPVQKAASKD